MVIQHQTYIERCIQLAKNGLGSTYPNPLVGSVVVHDDKIIGEGWHYQAGKPHAEVHAIRSVKNPSLLKDATIYVSLEPCSHFGKTPPCSDLIIQKGIKKVVIGTVDPFAKVSGTGIQKLIDAGCDVTVGVLEKKCQELNKRFFTFHNQKRPYIILKWAETFDGYIAPLETHKRAPVWITNPYSRQLVHKWRSQEQAILVGSTTVLKDNPRLTIRDWKGVHPIRIVIDLANRIPKDSHLLDRSVKTIIITNDSSKKTENDFLIYENIGSKEDTVKQICDVLYKHHIQSVIIEGGAFTIQSFITADLWDEARVFRGTDSFESGIQAPMLKTKELTREYILRDTLTTYKNDQHPTF